VPIILIVGPGEEQAGTVTIRRYGIQQQQTMPAAEFEAVVLKEIKDRRHVKE
jgi:threonyl-tRNA synthetase